MHRTLFAFVVLIGISLAYAQKSEVDQEHTRWIDGLLRSIDTVKPGMTRRDLSTLFVTEGGISTRTQRNYVYRQCPYIKVTGTSQLLEMRQRISTKSPATRSWHFLIRSFSTA